MVLSVKQDLDAASSDGTSPVPDAQGSRGAKQVDVADRVLDAAEELFYARGYQTVGMDAVRDRSGIALKRLYQCFSSKEALVVAMLERRDARWRTRLSAYVTHIHQPEARILAVFDWLGDWFAEPGFRGCAWVNAHGELGAVSPAVADQARRHKATFKGYLAQLVAEADLPSELTDQLALIAEGAMTQAGIFAATTPASHARTAAQTLIQAAGAKSHKSAPRSARVKGRPPGSRPVVRNRRPTEM